MPRLIGGDVDFIHRAPIRIENELEIRQPPEAVWAVLIDTEGWPNWFKPCKQARTTSDQRQGVGSTRFMQVELFKISERIIVWDEPKRWGFTIDEANLPLAKTVVEVIELRPAGTGTSFTWSFAIELKAWMRPFGKLFEWYMRRLFRTGLPGLQLYLDSLEPRQADQA